LIFAGYLVVSGQVSRRSFLFRWHWVARPVIDFCDATHDLSAQRRTIGAVGHYDSSLTGLFVGDKQSLETEIDTAVAEPRGVALALNAQPQGITIHNRGHHQFGGGVREDLGGFTGDRILQFYGELGKIRRSGPQASGGHFGIDMVLTTRGLSCHMGSRGFAPPALRQWLLISAALHSNPAEDIFR